MDLLLKEVYSINYYKNRYSVKMVNQEVIYFISEDYVVILNITTA
jgi:hypothetical protein